MSKDLREEGCTGSLSDTIDTLSSEFRLGPRLHLEAGDQKVEKESTFDSPSFLFVSIPEGRILGCLIAFLLHALSF